MKRIAVIGAGFGGLSAAIRLAAQGCTVDVYERNATPGGKASEVRVDGYRFDTGPSLLTMPSVVDDLYAAAGRQRDVELLPVDPLCRYTFADGAVFDAWSNEQDLLEEIRAFAPGEEAAVRRFLDYSMRIYDLTSDFFLFNRLDDLKNLLHIRNLRTLLQLPRIDAFRTVHEAVAAHFRDPRLVQLFDRYATYNGSDPFKAPATLNIIPHVEYRMGGYYVRGGMYSLVNALEKLAVDVGVKLYYNATVNSILMNDRTVRGLNVHGERLPYDAVVSNADAVYTLTRLLEGAAVRKSIARIEASCSGLVFLWGIARKNETLRHHNIFFSSDYRREFREIFDEGKAPSDPTVYVSITSRADPDHAPQGKENWFVLINMPALTSENREADIDSLREAVLARLAATGIDIQSSVESETVITPSDLEQRFNAHKGSIYGISSNTRNAAFLRPRNKVSGIRGLYLCGGAAHPGGGVPLVILSGQHAAAAVIKDMKC
jgi:phytoene desaturase